MNIVKATEHVRDMVPKECDFAILTRDEYVQVISVAWISGMQDALVGEMSNSLNGALPGLIIGAVISESAKAPLRNMINDWLLRCIKEES